jgi:hypothetical protein
MRSEEGESTSIQSNVSKTILASGMEVISFDNLLVEDVGDGTERLVETEVEIGGTRRAV